MKDASIIQGKDVDLHQATQRTIDVIQRVDSITDFYRHILQELCTFTGSLIGFVLMNELEESGAPILNCHCFYSVEILEDTLYSIPTSIESKDLFHSINNDKPFVLVTQHLRTLNNHCENWPKLHQAIAFPLAHESTGCTLFLANAEAPYHTKLTRRLWPFLNLCKSYIRLLVDRSNPQHDINNDSNSSNQVWRNNFSELESLAPLGIIALDNDCQITRINPMAELMFGVKHELIHLQSIGILIPEFTSKGGNRSVNTRLQIDGRHGNGEYFPLEINIMRYCENELSQTLLLLRDFSDLEKMQACNQAELERFRTLADLAPMGILQTDEQWQTLYVNNRWLDITGRKEEDIQGLNWGNALYHEDAELTLTELHACLAAGLEYGGDCRIQRGIEEILWVQLHARPIYDRAGNVHGFLATMIDNSYYHLAEEKLRRMAERDALTGLANRVLFMDRLGHALDRLERHGSLAVLALDLDGFKNINDTLGHDAGDQLLVDVAERIQHCVRHEDTVSRVGGDEFIILLEDLHNASIAAQISEKILTALQKPVYISHQEVFISTSIGICFAVSGRRVNAKTLLKQADMALYRAKDAGRNNYQYYSPELELASRRRLELGNSLHHALAKAEFDIYYQAQALVATNEVIGVEALLRWQHPHRGLLPPDEFIPLLEESGLITTVSRWMLHITLHELRGWIQSGLVNEDMVMSLNVSPCQFRDPLLLSSIKGALKDSGLKGSNLVIEMTESAMLQEHSQTLDCLNQLRELGVKIALDDFGTGYSSLSYLKKYPIDIIKIDRSFIKDILTDQSDATITQGVLALAKSLGMKIVAEGVEDQKTLTLLQQWGCEHYQGYLLNKPMASGPLLKLLKTLKTPSLVLNYPKTQGDN